MVGEPVAGLLQALGAGPGVAVAAGLVADDGTVRHFDTTQAALEFRPHRGIDLMNLVWHLFGLLPEGRGDWFPKHGYG